MSEYQYYEFQAVDKPLTEKDMQALSDLSTRAQITPTSFVNEYNYGDFSGDPLKLVAKYFDAFLYVANWGTHWFMLKVPRHLVDVDLVNKYCPGESAVIHEKGNHLIFEFTSETEDYEWEEGEGWLSSLISLERKRRTAEKKAREQARKKREKAIAREEYLASLVGREDSIWQKVDEIIDLKQPAKYDEAVNLLVDLRDLYTKTGTEKVFNQKLKTICENHYRKMAFLNRLQKAGLRG